jgi:peptide/nickel transport system ATP-binding protein
MLLKLRDEHRMTIVFITHDLGLAYYVSDTILIMSQGRITERGDAEKVITIPRSPTPSSSSATSRSSTRSGS